MGWGEVGLGGNVCRTMADGESSTSKWSSSSSEWGSSVWALPSFESACCNREFNSFLSDARWDMGLGWVGLGWAGLSLAELVLDSWDGTEWDWIG